MMSFREYIVMLNSFKCQCGEPKKPKTSFCKDCFKKLPFELTEKGYLEIRKVYLQFYESSLSFLKTAKTREVKEKSNGGEGR